MPPVVGVWIFSGTTHFLLLLGGGGRDDTCKSVIVTLSNLWGGQLLPPLPLARYGPVTLIK